MSTRSCPPAAMVARRRVRPHERPGLAQREALAGRRRAARRRNRRHLDREHPAPRVAQRRRRAHHRHQAAGDRPRRVVRRADQIELVDMTPEALRRRMAHGNIYPPGEDRRRPGQLLPAGQPRRAARARAAVGRRPGRRRARRTTASGTASTQPWETRERVVVAITGAPGGDELIRRAARMAQRATASSSASTSCRSDGLRRGRRPSCSTSSASSSRSSAASTAGRGDDVAAPRRLRPRGERHPARARRQPAGRAGTSCPAAR